MSRISAYGGKLLKFSAFFGGFFFFFLYKEKSEIGKRDYLEFRQGRAKIPLRIIDSTGICTFDCLPMESIYNSVRIKVNLQKTDSNANEFCPVKMQLIRAMQKR